MSKLRYTVLSSSSADPEFPASQLNVHSPHTRGWQTPRFCEYPQHVIIELANSSAISQIQLLSHQHKIATRIEIFVGSESTSDDFQPNLWTRLGYMSLDANQRSQYQARELKSVYLDVQGRYIKLVTHRCHINRMNLFNQVGIIALNILGKCKSYDLAPRYIQDRSNVLMPHNDSVNDLAFDINVDARAAELIRSLLAAKEAAVEAEDYDTAKRLKVAERELHALGGQLAQLEISKRRAARDEDYDRAKLLKNEIISLQRRIDVALSHHDIEPSTHVHQLHPSLSPPLTPSQRRTLTRDEPTVSAMRSYEDRVEMSNNVSGYATSLPKEQTSSSPHVASAGPSRAQTPRSPELESQPRHDVEQNDTTQSDGASESYPSAVPSAKQALLSHFQIDDSITGDDPRDLPLEAVNALAGVPNAGELPTPESFTADMGADIDIESVRAVLGDYRARCLLSKNWALREASLAKTRLLVDENHWEQLQDFACLCDIARMGVHDKIAQVYLTALALAEDVAHKMVSLGIKHCDALPALEPVLSAIVSKLGENQPRLRDKAVDALTALSQCGIIGAGWLAEKVMMSLEARRQHNKWRPIATRLGFLKRLAVNFGVENRDSAKNNPSAPLVLESIIIFVERHGCASHTFEEVRTATKDLMVIIFITASMEDRTRHLDPFLAKLRPKQVKEYRNAIERGLAEQTHQSDVSSQDNSKENARWLDPGGEALKQIPGNVPSSCSTRSSPKLVLTTEPRNEVDEFLRSEDLEEERFRDQIMKQLEERAFSVQEAYEILKEHFWTSSQLNPIKESVLAEWVNEVGSDVSDDGKQTRDDKLWKVATWLFQ